MGKATKFTLALVILSFLILGNLDPIAQAKVTVNGITVTTDKEAYTLGSEVVAKATLDYSGAKKDLLGVNFTWYYPNGTAAKFDYDVAVDGFGSAYSSYWPDEAGLGYSVNATYVGDSGIFNQTSFDVEVAPPSNLVIGPIGVDTTWTRSLSPYRVVGDVFVETQATLVIEPGVLVEFENDTTLVINGTLLANGTETNMITFTSSNLLPTPGDWIGILFNRASPESTLDFCRIEYAYIGVDIFESQPRITHNLIRDISRTGVQAYKSGSYIGYNTITHIVYSYASNKGINLLSQCSTTLEHNVISDVEEYGIKIQDSNPIIRHNYLSGSLYNIEISGSQGVIVGNFLSDAVDGIRAVSCGNIQILGNEITDCAQYGIRMEGTSGEIRENTLSGHKKSALWLFKCSDMEVIDCFFFNNERGIDIYKGKDVLISNNFLENQTRDGVYSLDSEDLIISENSIINCRNGTYLMDTNNISMVSNNLIQNLVRAVFFFNCSNSVMEANYLLSSNVGIYMHSSDGFLSNSTITQSMERDIMLVENAHLDTLNLKFNPALIIVSQNSVFVVRNYLHVLVQNDTYKPIPNAEVNASDGIITLFTGFTDFQGIINNIVLTDSIYNGSNTPLKNHNLLTVKSEAVYFEHNPREPDMSTSHTEVFGPGNPLYINIKTPQNNSLAFDTINISGTVKNLQTDTQWVEIRLDEGQWFEAVHSEDESDDFWFLYNTMGLDDGHHRIHARVISTFYEKSTNVTIRVDNIGNKPPEIFIISHTQSEKVNGAVKLYGVSRDYDGSVVSVDVRIDLGAWIAADNLGGSWFNWSFEINSSQYPNGSHNISVMALDNSTETSVITLELIFNNIEMDDNGNGQINQTEEPQKPPIVWSFLAVLIPLILCVVMYVIIRKKKGEKEVEPPKVDDSK